MITVVIIASDQRADLLKDLFQPLLKAQICVDSDYELGLKSVFDKRPALVFIQGEISGVSGGAIAKQIKGLLRDAAPRIVLMGDAASLKEKARSWYDDSLDFSLPEGELIPLFREQLSKHLPDIWRDVPALTCDSAGGRSDAVEPGLPASSGASFSPAGDLVGNTDMASMLKPEAIPPAAAHTAVKLPSASESAPKKNRPAVQTGKVAFPGTPALSRQVPQFEPTFPERAPAKSHSGLYLGGLAAALVLAALIYYLSHHTRPVPQARPQVSSAPKAQAPRPPATQPETRARIARLPESVPVAGRDPGYEPGHPGWSRYTGDGMEFKVFSDKGEIKAIQVLAGGARSIPEDMPKSLLGQIFGYASYSSVSSVEKQSYLVQQASLPGAAEMLVYRKKGAQGIRGIVISVP